MQQQTEKGTDFSYNDTATTKIYTLSLHDALPILSDSMGTLVEDMVVPNAERIAAEIFGENGRADVCTPVSRSRRVATTAWNKLAAGRKNLMVVESKRHLRPEDPEEFLQKLKRVPE